MKCDSNESKGHYEKITSNAYQYYYVNSQNFSGIDGAVIVPREEVFSMNLDGNNPSNAGLNSTT